MSAKNPRRWGVLFECRGRFVEEPRAGAELPPVRDHRCPTARRSTATIRTCDDALSRIVGRPVRLETPTARGRDAWSSTARTSTASPMPQDEHGHRRARSRSSRRARSSTPRRSTSSRPRRSRAWPSSRPTAASPCARFRPNVVVAVDDATGFVENDWVSRDARASAPRSSASVFLAAPRCVMTTLAQPDLPPRPRRPADDRAAQPLRHPRPRTELVRRRVRARHDRRDRAQAAIRSRSRADRVRAQPARLLRGRARVGARRDRHGRRHLVLARDVVDAT